MIGVPTCTPNEWYFTMTYADIQRGIRLWQGSAKVVLLVEKESRSTDYRERIERIGGVIHSMRSQHPLTVASSNHHIV